MAVGSFDHVNLRKGAGWDLVSADYFWKLSLEERVGLIMDERIEFISDGKVIPVTQALQKPGRVEGGDAASAAR